MWDFSFYRFLTGLGVGGQFSVGVALVAEVMPARARPYALGSVQALSSVGNMMAALIGIVLGKMEQSGSINSSWRMMFLVGALPALLAIVSSSANSKNQSNGRRRATPNNWAPSANSFTDPRWRKNTLVGMTLAFAGVVGLWGIGFFSFDLISSILDKTFRAEGLSESVIAGKKTLWTGITSLLQNAGAFFGIYAFTYLTAYTGRKIAFALAFVLAMITTAFTFWFLKDFSGIFWMIPMMGFCQLALFGGYSIYFPELFPTRLRSTGTSFCYNVGRFVAALGPVALGLLSKNVFRRLSGTHALRRRHHVSGLPRRPCRAAVRPRNERQAAARIGDNIDSWPESQRRCLA